MGSFTPTAPAQLCLEVWEERDRATNIAATGSPSPVPFTPLPSLAPYTHLGHDSQYGRGRRNGRTVRLLILHTTETDSFTGSMSYGARRPDQVSATAYAGRDGELGYAVAESDRPYTTQRWNDESLAVEICGKAAYTEAQWRARPRQLEAIVTLLVAWCQRHNVPAVWLSAAQVAQGASPLGTTPVQGINRGITDHWEGNLAARLLGASAASTSHHDIGPGLRAVVFATIIPEVARRLQPTPTPPSEEDEMKTLHVFVKGDPTRAEAIVQIRMDGFNAPDEVAPTVRVLGAEKRGVSADDYDALLRAAT